MKINPNSSIRSGYKYEDLFTLKLCVDWLLDPKLYESIRIQYKPEDIEITHFAIDDIVAQRKDGGIEYYQIKHKQNPETDLWDFNQLFNKGLSKWMKSYFALKEPNIFCSLITNGNIAPEIEQCLQNGYLNPYKISDVNPEFLDNLKSIYTDLNLINIFFREFCFQFNQPNKKDLEEILREILYKQLKVTKAGVDSLLLFIANEGAEKHPKTFTLSDIRLHLSWDNPRPLNQNFEIPTDFEFFNKNTHQDILKDLTSIDGGIKVFIGKPGSGKSTYLSKLYTLLKKENTLVFRHHYHLNPKDNSYADRLNSERVIEGLKAEFKKQKNTVIKSLGEQNTTFTQLKEFIDQISGYCRNENKSFILIIDGLDHVIREGNSQSQLIEFLNEVLYPQKGYWLILGTQEMATNCFPNIINQYAPRKQWIEIKGLKRESIKKIAIKAFPKDYKIYGTHFETIVSKLSQITKGNPLHLRYVLTEIKNLKKGISEFDLDRIPHYNTEIEDYYKSLWQQLSSLAKTISFALTSLDFKLQEEQLTSLASNFCQYPYEITDSFAQIRHLFRFELSGISVYHNSFFVFIHNQPELNEQKILLYRILQNWLKEKPQYQLCWSELPKVEYYLGNPDMLLNIDNSWIVNQYLDCHSETTIENILSLATKAAFETNQLDKLIYFSIVENLFSNRYYNLDKTLGNIWAISFKTNKTITIQYPDFSVLTHYQLAEIVIALKKKGITSVIPEEAIDRINELFTEANHEINEIAKSWIQIVINYDTPTKRIFKFIKQFRGDKHAAHFFKFYLEKLFEQLQQPIRHVEEILKTQLLEEEKEALAEVLIAYDLQNVTATWAHHIDTLLPKETLLQLFYKSLFGYTNGNMVELIPLDSFPIKVQYHSSESEPILDLLKHNLLGAFINAYMDLGELPNMEIMDNDPNKIWVSEMYIAILSVAKLLSDKAKNKSIIDIQHILSPIEELDILKFPKNYDIYEYRRIGIPYIIDFVLWMSYIINKKNNHNHELQYQELNYLKNNKWYNKASLFTLINSKRIKPNKIAVQQFITTELQQIQNEIIPFTEKCDYITDLAILATTSDNNELIRPLLERATANILAYSHHKYMLLHDILESIEVCINAASNKSKDFLIKIFPYIHHIEKLTDGDETRHFITVFCNLLAKVDPRMLYNIYMYNLSIREYDRVESTFDDILHTLNFDDPVSKAIGKTAVNNLETLNELQKSNTSIKDIINNLTSKFGINTATHKQLKQEKLASKINKDHSHIKPEELKEHLVVKMNFINGRITYSESSFLNSWLNTRLNSFPQEEYQIIKVLKEIFNNRFSNISAELLDTIYPIAYKYDKEFAFNCICWAQSNGSGWSPTYMRRMKESQKRWKNVLKDYPGREQEFYCESVKNTGLHYGKEKNYNVPIPKSTQFYVDCGDISKAENITNSYLNLLPEIFPNIELPVPDFFLSPAEITPFEILLSRLMWINPVTKASAAEAIADILKNDFDGQYHEIFFNYLLVQSLENRACEGLLILIKSLQNINSLTFKFLNQNILNNLLSVRCLATDLLMQNIAETLKLKLNITNPLYFYATSGKTELNKEDFQHLVGRNLPLCYIDYVDSLKQKAGNFIDVWNVWCTSYEEYCQDFDLTYDKSKDEDYSNSQYNIITGRTTVFGDILKSTFMKLVDFLYNYNLIDSNDLWHYTIKNLPIDYSLWKIKFTQCPSWWPQLNIKDSRTIEEIDDYKTVLIEFLQKDNDSIPLFFNGNFSHGDNHYDSNVYCQLKAFAFATPKTSSLQMDAKQLYKHIAMSGFWYPANAHFHNYGTLDGKLRFHQNNQSNQYVPLISEIRTLANNMWQYYRMKDNIVLLSPIFDQETRLDYSSGILTFTKDQNEIASFNDFLLNFKDTSRYGTPAPYNSYLIIDRKYLRSFLKKKNLTLSFVIKQKISVKDRMNRDDLYNSTNSYKIIHLNDF
ncbi:ATP-binding protein [Chryseobacterium sp. L7]|uniref:ATP-binding protein n=1 Tax=Chryseobacterium endalhagicum TaxID=2797638 RepID=A0ABS1QCR3_9FLAO|nr:ATP-binding protein [Chryseobacterium endalhagicum]MBL1220414.1 ATP-binding protein [Chryseobacterium endalhagicum]